MVLDVARIMLRCAITFLGIQSPGWEMEIKLRPTLDYKKEQK